MTANNPPMDWYPDPADPARERYWDGERWTHNTRERQAVPTPPPSSPWGGAQHDPFQPAPSGQAQPGQPPAGPAWAAGGPAPMPSGQAAATADGVALSGWWRRVLAYLVDSLLVGLASVALGWNFARQLLDGFSRMTADLMAQARAGTEPPTSIELLEKYHLMAPASGLQSILLAVMVAYFLLMWRFRGATLGQMLLGIRVVPADQGRAPRGLPWGRAILRTLALLVVAQLPLVPILSYLMPLWTRRRQTLHDMLATTQVVRER